MTAGPSSSLSRLIAVKLPGASFVASFVASPGTWAITGIAYGDDEQLRIMRLPPG